MDMNRLLSAFLVSTITLFAFTRVAEAGQCRLEILLDRSDVMRLPRQDGAKLPDNTIPTRGYAAGLTVLEVLAAFEQGDFYDINKLDDSGIIVSSSDEYDQKCPNATDRKVSIRIFKTDSPIDHPDPNDLNLHWNFTQITAGFVAPADAYVAYKASDLWDKGKYVDSNGVEHKYDRPTEVNTTPYDVPYPPGGIVHFSALADGMCISARGFGQGPGSSFDLREIFTLSAGGEVASNQSGCRTDNIYASNGMPPGALGSGGWGDAVHAEYAAHGIQGHGVLFEGAQGLPPPSAAAMLNYHPADLIAGRSAKVGALAVTSTTAPVYPPANDLLFFQQLAAATGGKASAAIDTTPIAPTSGVSTTTDTDGDGVPDFRDFCPFGMCQDIDGDQIPDNMDLCKFTQSEDGKGPFPADGCSDFDADGIRDGLDLCPAEIEDWYPPRPNDGCLRVPLPAPAATGVMLALLGLGMLGLGMVMVRRPRARLGQT
jgi:Thrombospondin type 3 repeat